MVRYYLPKGMRYSTPGERQRFYRKEFNLNRVKEWFETGIGLEGVIFAAVVGRHTKIYPELYKEDASITILIDEYRSLKQLRNEILEFTPESVYYDRNIYVEEGKVAGQELTFDIDPENLTCPIHGTLEDKMKLGQGLSFCKIELKMVKEETQFI